MSLPGTTRAAVRVVGEGGEHTRDDLLAVEEPLEIRLGPSTVAVTMRTPGSDLELAAGFLFTEGIVGPRHTVEPDGGDRRHNTVTVRLAGDGPAPDLGSLERYGTISSACGVCGKTTLAALRRRGIAAAAPGEPRIRAETLYGLPAALKAGQRNFAVTGGLHAAGLFRAADGCCLAIREDVGRHNAVDKVIGWAVLTGRLEALARSVLVVSGRAGFEIVQKAAAAGIAVVGAVSAPSSLAVDVATEFGLTLVGFLRDRRMNVYTGADRLR